MSTTGTSTPAFSQVIHAEIAQYGFAGATLLALIRFRCLTDGPDRVSVNGVRHWKVSYADIGKVLGVTKDVVRTGLAKCGDAITANQVAPFDDRKKAYHVPPYDEALNSKWESDHTPDQQVGISPPHVGNPPHPVVKIPHPVVDSPHVPISVEGEEGGEGDGSSGQPAATLLDGELANSEPATPEANRPANVPPTQLTTQLATSPPSPYCARHPQGTTANCAACGAARKEREAFDQEQAALIDAERAAIRAEISACPECDQNGFTEPDDGPTRRCTRHRQLADLPAVRRAS